MSSKVEVRLPDDSILEVEKGTTWLEVARRIGERLAQAAVAVLVDGQLKDVRDEVEEDCRLEILTAKDERALEVLRHSCAHLMAQAVRELYPGTKVAIGPAIADGFYYDFDLEETFDEEALKAIEARMKALAKAKIPIEREKLRREAAIRLFEELDEPYKVELLEEMEAEEVTLYRQGEFVDLCRGPHVQHTGACGAFKLLSVAGAYWRGDEHNKMLQRIYGTTFPDKQALKAHLAKLEEAKKRDHRKLGAQLDLFSFHESVGPGLVLFHPKGALLRKVIEDFERQEHLAHDYELVVTPHIAQKELWDTSGHSEFYSEHMFLMEVEDKPYVLKPMNCPFHILVYKHATRSYRDLPIKYFELGTVYRYERSGVLHGLLRVRGFTQDDAHVFCRPDQLQDELTKLIAFVKFMLKSFGFEKYEVTLATQPEKFVGEQANWDLATEALKQALENTGLEYEIEEGEGAFYGPKIDLKLVDAIGRLWQCSTIQVDFNIPERFDVTYVGEDGKPHRPVMIHRALLGSLERFIGCLVEHYAGAFPLWLAPEQVVVVPIAERHHEYAAQVGRKLRRAGLRVRVDKRSESVSYKIREAQVQKIPYMLVVGDREAAAGQVAVRRRDGTDEGAVDLEALIPRLVEEAQPPASEAQGEE